MTKAKRMVLGMLLSLGMMLGLCMAANAATFTELKIGDVIREGDTIGPFDRLVAYQQYTEDGSGVTIATAKALTLIKVGNYYGFKRADSENNTIGYMNSTFRVTDISDGLYVKNIATIEIEDYKYENGIILAVHEVHTHSYSSSWTKNDSNHWHECTGQGGTCDAPKKDEAAHSYGTSGNARFTCSVCGYVSGTKKAEAEAADKTPSNATVTTTVEEPQELVTITTAPKSVKAKAKKNKITVTWKKIKKNKKGKKLLRQINSIEVQYSVDLSFPAENSVKIPLGKKKTKLVLKGLQKGIAYFVRVRYTDGAGGYSNWSAVKRAVAK